MVGKDVVKAMLVRNDGEISLCELPIVAVSPCVRAIPTRGERNTDGVRFDFVPQWANDLDTEQLRDPIILYEEQ